MNTSAALPLVDASLWRARLDLRFAPQHARTVLAERRHVGPLVVQRPFYPEGEVCHVYLIHPPGGVVGGDRLHLQAQLDAGAHALITTPAATKFYRAAPGRVAVVEQQLRLCVAQLEWLPQESIFFDAAQVRLRTRVDLDAASRFIGWELACYGRRASGEAYASGLAHQALELWCEGKPLLLDHLRVQGGDAMQTAAWGLQGRTALGSLLAYPAGEADVEALRELAEQFADHSLFSVTRVDQVLLCRCLAEDGALVKECLLKVWQCLRPRLMQREALAPRIWAT